MKKPRISAQFASCFRNDEIDRLICRMIAHETYGAGPREGDEQRDAARCRADNAA